MKRRVKIGLFCLAFGAPACKQSSDVESELPAPAGSGVAAPNIPRVADLITETAKPDDSKPRVLSGTGTLYAREEAQLGPKMTGVLSQVLVDEGDRVKKGQVLFRIDAAQASLAVQQARAQLESARVALHASELDFQRTKELHERGSVPAAAFDQAKARYDSAKSAVTQAEVALNMSQRGATDTVVYSPISGVVTQKFKSVGETVTLMPPTVVFLVQDVSVLELRVRLPERALGALQPGAMLDVSFPAIGLSRRVPVKRTNPAVDIATRTIEVVAELENKDGRLKPGMLADVQIQPPGAPSAPASASGAPNAAPAANPASARRPTP